MNKNTNRCDWASAEIMIDYHDREWGVPIHDDRLIYEHLVLDGAQAGLSWLTILKKRENYRKAFEGFDPRKVAKYDAKKIAVLMNDTGIVRNKLKVASAVANAKAFLEVQKEFGTFDRYIWGFVGGKPLVNRWNSMKDIPAKTPESIAMSKDLLKRGFRFVGPTICYAFMQASGLVNDHLTTCYRHKQVGKR